MEIQIGDIIKSYDFARVTDYYSVGHVTGICGEYIYFTCIEKVWDGAKLNPSEYSANMRTLKMGCLMSDETFQRLEVLY